jgi:hypothetical protein
LSPACASDARSISAIPINGGSSDKLRHKSNRVTYGKSRHKPNWLIYGRSGHKSNGLIYGYGF